MCISNLVVGFVLLMVMKKVVVVIMMDLMIMRIRSRGGHSIWFLSIWFSSVLLIDLWVSEPIGLYFIWLKIKLNRKVHQFSYLILKNINISINIEKSETLKCKLFLAFNSKNIFWKTLVIFLFKCLFPYLCDK